MAGNPLIRPMPESLRKKMNRKKKTKLFLENNNKSLSLLDRIIKKIMGVMSCSRRYCDSIMCDTYINDIGYVCRECEDEFRKYLKDDQIQPSNDNEFKSVLKIFMETDKDTYIEKPEIDVSDFFNQYRN